MYQGKGFKTKGLAVIWNLPPENKLSYTGQDWVLVLLDSLNQEMRSKLMFIWWRAVSTRSAPP
jgi:hypothetical protein